MKLFSGATTLIANAFPHAIHRFGPMVSKDNKAINLYKQQGFMKISETDDSFLIYFLPAVLLIEVVAVTRQGNCPTAV
jgi:hypothetical protein